MPALSLTAVPGRRKATIELAQEIERRGFSRIFVPSPSDPLALCEALAFATKEIPFATGIMPIYFRHAQEVANTVSFIHEISDGRFHFGIGVSHGPELKRRGIPTSNTPVADTRDFVEALRAAPRIGELPPVVIAALRSKMTALAGEIAQGVILANGVRSNMQYALSMLPEALRSNQDFMVANMIPVCISDDVEAARACNLKRVAPYVHLPNYRNYWKEAGYQEEMLAIEKAIAAGDLDSIPRFLTGRWIDDISLSGTALDVREGFEAWLDAGVNTPVLSPASINGGQMVAYAEFLEAY